MKVLIIALVLLVCTSMYSEAKAGGRGKGGKGGGKGGWIQNSCGTDPKSLKCPSGTYPKLFKGSGCSEINDDDELPNFKNLDNPCEGQTDGTEVEAVGCLVCTKKQSGQWWKSVVAKNGKEVDLAFTFPCVAKPYFGDLTCEAA